MKEASHKEPHVVKFSLYQMSRISISVETERRSEGVWDRGGQGKRGVTANGTVSSGGEDHFLKLW